DKVFILDETKLPEEKVYIAVEDYLEAAKAITEMKTRAFGQVLTVFYTFLLTARHNRGEKAEVILPRLKKVGWALESARPTFAFKDLNKKILGWAERAREEGEDIPYFLEDKILAFLDNLKKMRLRRADYAASLIKDGEALLTHCNVSGEMVLIGRACREAGKRIRFYATETRPYFQGRLTSWELAEDGFDVTLLPDNAVGSLISECYCQLVMVGSDRVALNGDVVNKVGTFQLAVAAKTFHIPFYVLVQEPGSTKSGEEIPIEERDVRELLYYKGRQLYPEKVGGYYPAFDLTPVSYITRLITFGGIINPGELPQGWKKVQGGMKN
ncbi:MAG: S-methyl-5-thioribose-1-phosphate isomerase, partial [Deltaproteobacteria bacterium]|nr:S-methyl-5-thioribose-1-phosphate isomerase [Deltaproteobacteria bacterium]